MNMDRPDSQRRFALLVGINLYLKNGTNKKRDAAINDLGGCVNDINLMKAVVRDRFGVTNPVVLTSSPGDRAGQFRKPKEPADLLPTYTNIERAFAAVTAETRAGDIFFFHYSGHGGLLPCVAGSPNGRRQDPSLLTVDFCLNGPPVRGWELNKWLKRLNAKGVQVIVILDSCYSGGSWRNDQKVRTPADWDDDPDEGDEGEAGEAGEAGEEGEKTPEDANDETSAEQSTEPSTESSLRNAALEKSWSINPDGFTLMAACKADEVAKEVKVNGKSYGAFTHELVKLLSFRDTTPSTYCVLREKVAERLETHKQHPEVFGRDRLVFFDNYEPFLTNPLVSRVEGTDIIVPIGRVHGVRRGTQFAQIPLFRGVFFDVYKINEGDCRATLSSGNLATGQCSVEVVTSKWGLGDETFKVYVHEALGDEFQEALYKRLGQLLTGNIEVEEFYGSPPNKEVLTLTKQRPDGVAVSGPSSLIGYEGPLQCLDLKGTSDLQLAARAAVALAHLARFSQILFDLPEESCQESPPFEFSITETSNPGDANLKVKFVFKNTGDGDLYLNVLSLHPGFGVRQIYPGTRSRDAMGPGKSVSFTMGIKFPSEIWSRANRPESQRDMIRVIATSGEDVSWRSLELPDIWQVDQVEVRDQASNGRDFRILEDEFRWWVVDHEITAYPPEGF
ncbi:caspase domain-containing protein [Dactylonectria macrodidyma]|uniref:Caspase domain-containing protein n=1 Tax=Dactylonectria macrodidyma TaxID=307937 RepID=A0A9P9J2D1_9HYPO|nr:caspase domain-containing protein [Dactylonectria macrodidyma]